MISQCGTEVASVEARHAEKEQKIFFSKKSNIKPTNLFRQTLRHSVSYTHEAIYLPAVHRPDGVTFFLLLFIFYFPHFFSRAARHRFQRLSSTPPLQNLFIIHSAHQPPQPNTVATSITKKRK
jgi:hypothetical protein